MRNAARHIFVAAASAAMLALAVSAGHSQAPATENVELTKVGVSIPPSIFALTGYVGLDEGLFEEAGLEVDLVPAMSGAEAVSLLLSGNLQFAFIDVHNAILGISNGLPVVASIPHAFTASETPPDGIGFGNLLVLADSGIDSPSDLEGRTVGTNSIGGSAHLDYVDTLAAAGADVERINWVEVPTPRQLPALRQGQIDGVTVAEPHGAVARAEGDVKVLVTADAAMQGGPLFTLISERGWAEENRDLILRLQEAFFKAAALIESDRSVAEKAMTERLNVSPELVADVRLPQFATEPFTAEATQPLVDRLIRVGALSADSVPDLDALYVTP